MSLSMWTEGDDSPPARFVPAERPSETARRWLSSLEFEAVGSSWSPEIWHAAEDQRFVDWLTGELADGRFHSVMP